MSAPITITDKILLRDVMDYAVKYFNFLEETKDMDFSIIRSFHEFFKTKNFMTIKQIEIIEKMVFRFNLMSDRCVNEMINYYDDIETNEIENKLYSTKSFFNEYYIHNHYAEREHKGQQQITKKLLWDIMNTKNTD